MKKVLFLILASFLILGACGQEESKSEDKKDTKSSDKNTDKDKDNKKDNNQKSEDDDKEKSDKKNNEENDNEEVVSNKEEQSQQDSQNQEQQDSQQQVNQEQQNNNDNRMHYDPEYDKYGYTGMVDEDGMPELDPNENFDPHGGATPGENYVPEDEPEEDNSDSESDNPYMNMPNQEWRANTGDGLSSGEKQTKQQILDGTFEGDDGDEILEALDYYQSKYGN
ncbi:hypothetical protein ACWEXP_12765 [Staphylococcus pseudoxylosus]|uniref:Lipoprotein n=1 Tax=Staphylococcus xylosus TaxID=1288 RepID=A0A077RJE2_STAXY|nr:hypothetical protein [Staphylococcus xylosus]